MVSALHQPRRTSPDANRLSLGDRAVHDWYRFVLSYPPHLVRDYLRRFGLHDRSVVLDPFCGTGTTIVECKKLGIASVGIEANPMAHFASRVKVDWLPAPDGLMDHALAVSRRAYRALEQDGVEDEPLLSAAVDPEALLRTLPPERMDLLLAGSISPRPLHKVLTLLAALDDIGASSYCDHELLALARVVVQSSSNLKFGPEVGVGPAKPDAPVIGPWLSAIRAMSADLRGLGDQPGAAAIVHHADARDIPHVLAPNSIDAVITSPPYPNEKDYTRTTRLESVLLGFLRSKSDLRQLKRSLVRSNTRGVYKGDDDDQWVAGHGEIDRIAAEIEARRIELGKTSGFERQYARVTKLYFGGMARHLAELRTVLCPGAKLAYVVGDQASYLRVMIRTGQLLADLAVRLGYELVGIDLFRTRLATATNEHLREEVVVLRWPGR